MTKNTSFAIRDFTLDPGDEMTISRTSDFLMCLEATDTFKVAFDDASDWDDFLGGLTFRPLAGFNKVSIHNPTGSAITVSLGFGKGDIKDSRLNLAGSITNREEKASFGYEVVKHAFTGAQTVMILGGSVDRSWSLFRNTGANRVWFGFNASVTVDRGYPVDPGESIKFEERLDIWAHSEGATDIQRIYADF